MEWADLTREAAWQIWFDGFMWGMGFVGTYVVFKVVNRLRSTGLGGGRND